jgi:hypothetical protein
MRYAIRAKESTCSTRRKPASADVAGNAALIASTKRTSMTWREDGNNHADGYDMEKRTTCEGGSVRAGSMDTTIQTMRNSSPDCAAKASPKRAEIFHPQIAIRSAHQFPLETAENPTADARSSSQPPRLRSLRGPFGRVFYRVT